MANSKSALVATCHQPSMTLMAWAAGPFSPRPAPPRAARVAGGPRAAGAAGLGLAHPERFALGDGDGGVVEADQ
jgi:hypothetical protein